MSLLIQLMVWLAISIVVLSFVEYTAHRWLMHKITPLHKLSAKLRDVWKRHAVLHHHRYYQVFNHEDDPVGKEINIDLNPVDTMAWSIPLALAIAPFSYTGAITITLVAWTHHFLWNIIHREMHQPGNRFFSKWKVFKYLEQYHFMHHCHPIGNFNVVVPLADFIMRTHLTPTKKELEQMEKLGL